MKEQLENKINEIIQYLISKPNDQITYNEYCILESSLRDIRNFEDSIKNKQELEQLMGKFMSNSISNSYPTPLVPLPEDC